MELNVGMLGATAQSYEKDNPRALLKEIMDSPKGQKALNTLSFLGARDEIWKIFEDDLASSIHYVTFLTTMRWYWYVNNFLSLYRRHQNGKGKVPPSTEDQKKEAALIEAGRAQLQAWIDKEASIKLLEMIMPDGRAFGDYTGAEVYAMGRKQAKWYMAVAAQLEPNQIVREHLTEEECQAFYLMEKVIV